MRAGRDITLIAVALFIDGLQAVLGWMAFTVGLGLQAITPAGGAVVGAGAGAYACWNSTTGTIAALIASGKCALVGATAGALASTFGIPLGTALGFILEIIVSLTLGSALVLLLIMNRMYYSTRTPIGIIVELIPGLDIIPGWTAMTIMCILKKRGEEKGSGIVNMAAKLATSAVASVNNPLSAARGAAAVKYSKTLVERPLAFNDNTLKDQGRSPLNLKSPSMHDVTPRQPLHAANDNNPLRAANDNHPYVQKAA